MKVKTIQTHTYAGTPRAIGDEYDMEDKFYPPMSAMGHVVRIEDSGVSTRDLGADQPKKYKRRDLKAEE